MRFLPHTDPAEELRDVLLMMVYLDEWRLYRPQFSVAKLK